MKLEKLGMSGGLWKDGVFLSRLLIVTLPLSYCLGTFQCICQHFSYLLFFRYHFVHEQHETLLA